MSDEEALVPHLHRQEGTAKDESTFEHLEAILEMFERRVVDQLAIPKIRMASLHHWALDDKGNYAHDGLSTHIFRCKTEDTLRDECAQLAADFCKQAKNTARMFATLQRFSVCVYAKPTATFPDGEVIDKVQFGLLGNVSTHAIGGSTESANAVGAMALTMRMHEAVAKQFVISAVETHKLTFEELERQRLQNDRRDEMMFRLLEQAFGRVKQYEELMMGHVAERQRLERERLELELSKQKQGLAADSSQEDKAWALVQQLAPVMLDNVSQKAGGSAIKPMVEQALALMKPNGSNGSS